MYSKMPIGSGSAWCVNLRVSGNVLHMIIAYDADSQCHLLLSSISNGKQIYVNESYDHPMLEGGNTHWKRIF